MDHPSLKIIREEHAAVAAMLRSLSMLLAEHRRHGTLPDFAVLRAMLFYLDEFPEKLHHAKESDLLFPRVVKAAPHTMATIDQLERDHLRGEPRVRELMHMLVAWELLGDGRRAAFVDEVTRYVDFYLEHMRLEETVILPEAERHLTETDWHALNAAFATNQDPLNGRIPRDPQFDRLFTRIVMKAPAPVGLGG